MALLKPFFAATASIFLLIFTTAISAQADNAAVRPCPTITASASHPPGYCHLATTPRCVVPFCITLATVSVPCGCPTTVPTSTSYYPCATTCAEVGCGTSYSTVLATTKCSPTKQPTKSPTPTTFTKSSSTTCQTITVTTGPACPKPPTTCSYVPDCIVLSSVTSRCGCGGTKGFVESTVCRTTCIQGCLTQFATPTTDGGGKACEPTPYYA